MKKIISAILMLTLIVSITVKAQNQQTENVAVQNDQAELVNDVYFSYGLGSLYFIVNQNSSDSYHTSGSFIFGYARSVGKVIAVGFQGSYTNVTHTENNNSTASEYADNYWSGLANIKFRYLNRPSFSMYSGVALGIAIDYITEPNSSGGRNYQKYYPAGQLTLLGFRVGRAFSFYGEFGIGTNAIINAGISYKFGN